jgi:hypothetical protein
MKHIAMIALILFVSACSTAPQSPETGDDEVPPVLRQVPLQDRLGMRRAVEDLGYAEKQFKDCARDGVCRPQYFSVVHFQLLCRDSEGTVSNVPLHLTPLTSDRVRWQLGGLNGGTRTDHNGFGQFTFVSERSARGQRLILRIGKQFMGFTVSEVTKVVLPQNFCI